MRGPCGLFGPVDARVLLPVEDTCGPRLDLMRRGRARRETGGRQMDSRQGLGDENAEEGTDEREHVVIKTMEELIASVPHLLGFPPPLGSVVMVCERMIDGGRGPVMRVDVPGLVDDGALDPGDDELFGGSADFRDFDDPDDPSSDAQGGMGIPGGSFNWEPMKGLARFCARAGVESVSVVVVRENCTSDALAARQAIDAAAAAVYLLELAGTAVVAAYGVEEFEGGALWVDLLGMGSGVQIDPASTHIAAANAFLGRTVATSRDEIVQMYLERDSDACEEAEWAPGRARDRLAGSVMSRSASEAMVIRHDRAALRLESGGEIDDDELAVIGRGLLSVSVRDEVYRRLASHLLEEVDGRRMLWWALARRRPARERSVALLLLGAASYFDGAGVHAGAAFDAALEADPANTFAQTLKDGLDSGFPPERLRWAASAAA